MSGPARLTGKRALVTGGGRGIGAAIARMSPARPSKHLAAGSSLKLRVNGADAEE
jgi:NAD(P)-dependent dehydrogenase (short-subunit alcohol dehydrogenase family)